MMAETLPPDDPLAGACPLPPDGTPPPDPWSEPILEKQSHASRPQRREKSKAKPADLVEDVEPWSGPVDPASLLGEVEALVHRHVICEPATATAAALWVALTWFADAVDVLPLAVITAPEKRCGKSTLLTLLGRLVRRPMMASSISAAAMFRVIEGYTPTLLIDEVDTFLRDNEELRGVINSGHTRSTAYVIRCDGDKLEPRKFSTWAPKALSGIGSVPGTIEDRALMLHLRRKLPGEKVARLRHADPGTFERVSGQLARFAEDAEEVVRRCRPDLPEALNDRAADNWEPLLAIAAAAGGEWPRKALAAALALNTKADDSASVAEELLSDVRDVLAARGGDRITTADLLAGLTEDQEAPWLTYNRGKPLSARQLARKLGGFGIVSKTIRVGGSTPKGYLIADFADAFKRYLPQTPPVSATSATGLNSNEKSVADMLPVADTSATRNTSATGFTNENNDVADVADRAPSGTFFDDVEV